MQFNRLIPELSVTDFEKSLSFYTKVLGFKVEYDREKFAFLSLQGAQIMIEEVNGIWDVGKLKKPFGRGVNFQIEVDSIIPIYDSLKKAGHEIFQEPKDNWYEKDSNQLGNREFLVQDPDGYLLRFAQDLGTKPL